MLERACGFESHLADYLIIYCKVINYEYMTYKNAKQWVCKYCNSIIVSRKCLFAHYKECKEKDKLPKDSLGRSIIPGQQKGLLEHSKSLKGTHPMGRPHTDEAKKKISEGRLKALSEGRGNHWICPHIKRSYAEQYFHDSFVNADVKFESNVWVCKRYCVDFLFGKYYFEVDGEQHFTEDAKKHDAERDDFLAEHGYICLGRCRWSQFKQLSKEEKEHYINGLVAQLAEANSSNLLQCEFESHQVY